MQENKNKNNFKKNIKKGHQALKYFLGYIEITKEHGIKFMQIVKNIGKNAGIFILGIPVGLLFQIKKIILFLFKIGKNTWEQIKLSFYKTLGILVAIFCVFTTLLLVLSIIFHFNPAFINILNSQYILTENNYKPETLTLLNQLVVQGKIISAGEVYNHVLEYYNTLITILLALLGVFGFISWFSIQSKIKHEAELCVDNKFENKDFQCRLQKEVEISAKEIVYEKNYLNRIVEENIDIIISKLLCNQNFINMIDEIVQNLKDDKADILRSRHKEATELEGIEDGDEI